MSHPLRLLLLDDNEDHLLLMRRSVRRLPELTAELVCCGTLEEARAALAAGGIDVAVLDYNVGLETSAALVRDLADRPGAPPVILVTSEGDAYLAAELTRLGVHRYLDKKDLGTARLSEAIASAVRSSADAAERDRGRADAQRRLDTLTPREREVAGLVAEGLLSKQIAGRLGCSPGTVNLHRTRIMHKTRAGSIADLVRMVLLAGGELGGNMGAGAGAAGG